MTESIGWQSPAPRLQVICCYQVTLGTTAPARLLQEAFDIFVSSRYRNLGPSERACGHYAYPNPGPLMLATPLVIHVKNWQCLDP